MAVAEENYRNDLSFKTEGIKKLQRKTLNLADVFNIIFEQLVSNDAALKSDIIDLIKQSDNIENLRWYIDDKMEPVLEGYQLAKNFTVRNGKLYQILRED